MDSGNFNSEKEILADDLEKFEFDEWRDLFESDPELFERCRKKLLQHQITLAPESAKPRLLGLMFQMEAEAIRSPTPISYSLKLSAMMMEKFDELRQKLNLLTGANADYEKVLQHEPESADIIHFSRKSTDDSQ